MTKPTAGFWIRMAVVVAVIALLGAAWKWTRLSEWANPERLAHLFEPYRTNWLAFPASIVVFVVAELLLFPVTVLIFVCGLAFGPWLGTLYAFAGSLASAVVPFWIGRRLGREKLERLGGSLVLKLEKVLDKRGVVAVFLVRKIPAPYTLVNLVCGASPLSLRDFVWGTILGMGTGIVLVTVISSQLVDMLRHPELDQILIGLVLLFVPVVFAILLQRRLNRRLEVES
jgi:phospholipase D1/2